MDEEPAIDASTVSGQLRIEIERSCQSLVAISEASGVDAGVIAGLTAGNRIVTLDVVDKLAAVLGLRLCPAADDAQLPPIRELLSLTAEERAARIKDDNAYSAWVDSVHEWSTRMNGKNDERWAARRELLIEWQQRGRDLQEWYLERVRRLNAGED